ncbi:UNKNOWN [Stylonychia lemnae]|uniref:Uncharacterized protein n=1 Tax=Stylonychia lemnae TaxID=5949 RepID=A0A078AUZ8_STYLE|nr:UNKNOWN [Stylonychia lemnae]|eukprot:CDW85077.1 UNKNOWN [Stylonychia lemnae]
MGGANSCCENRDKPYEGEKVNKDFQIRFQQRQLRAQGNGKRVSCSRPKTLDVPRNEEVNLVMGKNRRMQCQSGERPAIFTPSLLRIGKNLKDAGKGNSIGSQLSPRLVNPETKIILRSPSNKTLKINPSQENFVKSHESYLSLHHKVMPSVSNDEKKQASPRRNSSQLTLVDEDECNDNSQEIEEHNSEVRISNLNTRIAPQMEQKIKRSSQTTSRTTTPRTNINLQSYASLTQLDNQNVVIESQPSVVSTNNNKNEEFSQIMDDQNMLNMLNKSIKQKTQVRVKRVQKSQQSSPFGIAQPKSGSMKNQQNPRDQYNQQPQNIELEIGQIQIEFRKSELMKRPQYAVNSATSKSSKIASRMTKSPLSTNLTSSSYNITSPQPTHSKPGNISSDERPSTKSNTPVINMTEIEESKDEETIKQLPTTPNDLKKQNSNKTKNLNSNITSQKQSAQKTSKNPQALGAQNELARLVGKSLVASTKKKIALKKKFANINNSNNVISGNGNQSLIKGLII